ncbi:MAG: hypothetical protein ACK46Q_08065 [Hyphomonas sp.]
MNVRMLCVLMSFPVFLIACQQPPEPLPVISETAEVVSEPLPEAPAEPLVAEDIPAPAEVPVETAPATVFTAAWDAKPDGAAWTAATLAALEQYGQPLITNVPEDIADWCPDYAGLTGEARKSVWLMLISSLAKFESNHRADVTFQESFNDSQGNPVISRGLLQISIESGRGYRCDIPEAVALHDAGVNLTCGVRIMNRWIGERDSRVAGRVTPAAGDNGWRGAARYWSPFRDAAKVRSMAADVSALPVCGG